MAAGVGRVSAETAVPEGIGRTDGYPTPAKRSRSADDRLAVEVGLPVLLLLTKADKLASGARKAQLNMVREAVLPFMGDIQVDAFSSLKKFGVDKLRDKLDTWFSEITPQQADKDDDPSIGE